MQRGGGRQRTVGRWGETERHTASSSATGSNEIECRASLYVPHVHRASRLSCAAMRACRKTGGKTRRHSRALGLSHCPSIAMDLQSQHICLCTCVSPVSPPFHTTAAGNTAATTASHAPCYAISERTTGSLARRSNNTRIATTELWSAIRHAPSTSIRILFPFFLQSGGSSSCSSVGLLFCRST
jgi:hypothetical protein